MNILQTHPMPGSNSFLKQIFRVRLVVILMLFSCQDELGNFPEPVAGSHAGAVQLQTREITVEGDAFSADFGTITVSESRDSSSSRLIHLPFLRVHSSANAPAEPIFGLTGGPGNSNMTWDLTLIKPFLSTHDFVLVGYRGVDGSVILDCPEVKQVLKERDDPLTDAFAKRLGEAWAAAGHRLRGEGIDLDHYTMLDVIDDTDQVREFLKYPQLNMLSRSYGTRVAYLYGLRYPSHIRRSAMLCVNPPGNFVWDPAVTDAQLRYYSDLAARDSVMKKRTGNLYGSMAHVLGKMPDHWLFFPINEQKVRAITFPMLFHRNSSAMVFDAYVAAEQGDASGLALMTIAYDFMVHDMMEWGDLASKGVSADFDSSMNYMEFLSASPAYPLGSPMGQLLWGPLQYGRWPVRSLPEEYRNPKASDVETLLVSGSVDISTPAEHATNELLPFLPHGRQVILSECGHTADVLDPKIGNAVPMLRKFFDEGIVSLPKETAYVPMEFRTTVGFPFIMKGGLVLVSFLGLLIVWMLWKKLQSLLSWH